MSQNKNKFSFALNESLFFDKGQEVAEMVQISLDPDISIQPFHDYISIRGVIELQGEYRKVPVGEAEETGRNDETDLRFMDHVSDTGEAEAIFTHGFPVEISVPAYRVEDLNDITVNIESFDYEIPEQNQLILNSTIDIYGIRMEEAQADDRQEEEARSETIAEGELVNGPLAKKKETERANAEDTATYVHSEDAEQDLAFDTGGKRETETPADGTATEQQTKDIVKNEQDASDKLHHDGAQGSKSSSGRRNSETKETEEMRFQFDIKEVNQLESVQDITLADQSTEPEEEHRENQALVQENDAAQPIDEITGQTDVQRSQLEDEEVRTDEVHQVSAEEDGQRDDEETDKIKAEEEELAGEQDDKERWKNKKSQTLAEFFKTAPSSSHADVTDEYDPSPADQLPSSSHLDFEISSSSYESFESSSGPADVRYLADMFRDEEEEQFTKLRLCIVQHKDTVDSIAERYQVPTLQILKQNELDGDSLAEGQLLYIPVKKKN